MVRIGTGVPESLLTTCKRCGSEAYWETSTTTGKKYLANVSSGTNGWLARPQSPHTGTDCQTRVDAINASVERSRSSRAAELATNHPEHIAAMKAVKTLAENGSTPSEVSDALDHADSVRDKVWAQAKEQALKEFPTITVKSDEEIAQSPTARKGFSNKFSGTCVGCGNRVGVNEGLTSKNGDKWEVRCIDCHHGGK